MFAYFIDLGVTPHWLIYFSMFLMIAVPITYVCVVYHHRRDIPAELGIPKIHIVMFWIITIATFLPAAIYTYG